MIFIPVIVLLIPIVIYFKWLADIGKDKPENPKRAQYQQNLNHALVDLKEQLKGNGRK